MSEQQRIPRGSGIAAYTAAAENRSEVVQGVLEDISKKGVSDLNAFIDVLSLNQAWELSEKYRSSDAKQRVLDGAPFVVKDCFDLPGTRTTAATPALDDHVVSKEKEPATCIQQLLRAGAIPVGKTNMHELGLGTSGINGHTGATRNPHNLAFIAGGSSSGTGATVGAGVVPFGIAADTGGSGRIPAVFCGAHGFRPTTGRYTPIDEKGRIVPICNARDTPAPMARSVRELALLDSVLAGERSNTSHEKAVTEIKLGVSQQYFWEDVDEEVEKTTTDVLQRLKDNGIVIKPIEFPQDIVDLNKKLSMDLVFSDYFADLDGYLHSHDLDKKRTVHQLVESVESSDVSDILSFYQNNPISAERKREILEDERPRLQERLKHTMQSQEVQVIVFPTTPVPPTRIQQGETIELNGNSVPLFPTHVRNNDISANAGFPSLALCIGKTTKGLPIGINIEALPGCDQDVLAMGCTIEKYLKPPSVPQ